MDAYNFLEYALPTFISEAANKYFTQTECVLIPPSSE
jgi:hypothetical protein